MHVIFSSLKPGGRRTTFARRRRSGNGEGFRSVILHPQEKHEGEKKINVPRKSTAKYLRKKDQVSIIDPKKLDADAPSSDAYNYVLVRKESGIKRRGGLLCGDGQVLVEREIR